MSAAAPRRLEEGQIMRNDGQALAGRRKTRREMLQQYVKLQHELIDADPSSSSYAATIQSFRQMGYALISAGFEEDLDRLLRIRVLDGGNATPSSRDERHVPDDLHIIEQVPAHR
jgi:hypothetical protein